MNTITVEVPTKIAQKYGKKIVSYQELLELVEETFWTDFDVEPKMEMKDFYNILSNDGSKTNKDSK